MLSCSDRLLRCVVISRTAIFAACLLALGLGVQPAAAEKIVKVAILGGGQEVPPVATGATGCARFVIDTTAKTLSYHIVFSGLVGETAAHIHGPADPGANAGVLHPLPLGNPKIGVWNYPAASEGDILAGKTYVNIHTAANPGGEIRGQIVDMVALINGAQESPPNASPGLGFGLFNIDLCNNTLDYHISYAGLGAAETGAHIHGFAPHAVNAGVVHPLPAGPLKTGSWNYAESMENQILDGQTYVNIHSAALPGGEIRGQITRHVVPLDGTQEVPPNAAIGHGCAMLSVSPAAATFSYYLESSTLTGVITAQHIHGFAGPGVNAAVLHPIALSNPVIGAWNYGAASEPNVFAGLTYFNVHSAAFPGGEIRGQILFPPPPSCASDTNCDGLVNVTDLLALLAAWGPCPAAPAPCAADSNKDGVVNVTDLLALLAAWGPCP